MVANASSYRPPFRPPFFDKDPAKAIELLRQTIRRGVEVVFLSRGQDKAFCKYVTDEAVLEIHADIDSYCPRVDIGTWAMAIAIRFGFEAMRKQQVVASRKCQADSDSFQSEHQSSLKASNCSYGRIAQLLLDTHRAMVERLLAGENPVAISFDLDLDADFTEIFLDEAVRKLDRLNKYLVSAPSCRPFSNSQGLH